MELEDKKSIYKYLKINRYSVSRICYFESKKEKKKIKIQITEINKSKILITASEKLKYTEGFLIFHSYTFIFRFWTKVHKENGDNFYSCEVPNKIETFDQRKYIRFVYDLNERKTIFVFVDNLKQSIKVIIADISAAGIGLIIDDEKFIPEIGDIISIKTEILGVKIENLARVVNVNGKKIGCLFIERSDKFQINLNHLIIKEVAWRSEALLVHLTKMYKKKLEEEKKKKEFKLKKNIDEDFVESFREYFRSEMKEIIGVDLKEKEISMLENTVPNFVSSVYFTFKFNGVQFRAFFYMRDSAVYKTAKFVFKEKPSGLVVNANLILAEIGTQLFENYKKKESLDFEISSPSIIQSNKKLMAFLYKSPSIKIIFTTELGEATLLLLPENLKV